MALAPLAREVVAPQRVVPLLAARGAAEAGGWVLAVTALVHVHAVTGSVVWLGAAAICWLAPRALVRATGIVRSGRGRSRPLVTGGALRAGLALACLALVAAGGPVALVIAALGITALVAETEEEATAALVPELVGEAQLARATARLQVVYESARCLGAAGAGLALAAGSVEAALVVAAGVSVVATAFAAGVRGGSTAVRPTDAEGSAPLAGLRAMRAVRFALPVVAVLTAVQLVAGASLVLLVPYAADRLDLAPAGLAWLLGASALGAALAHAVLQRLASRVVVTAPLVVAASVASVPLLVFAATGIVPVALVAAAIGGAAAMTARAIGVTVLTRIGPAPGGGGATAVRTLVGWAAVLGAILAATVAQLGDLSAGLVGVGALALVVSAVAASRLRGLDAVSAQRTGVLAERVAVLRRLPVVAGSPSLVVELLADAAHVCRLPAGVDVVVQGAPAHAFYAVVDGGVVVHRDEQAVVELGPGEHFGERGLLDAAPRNATVTTRCDSTLLRIEGTTFLQALQGSTSMRAVLAAPVRTGIEPHGGRLVDDPTWSPA